MVDSAATADAQPAPDRRRPLSPGQRRAIDAIQAASGSLVEVPREPGDDGSRRWSAGDVAISNRTVEALVERGVLRLDQAPSEDGQVERLIGTLVEPLPRRGRGRPRKAPGSPRVPLKNKVQRRRRRPLGTPTVTTGIRIDDRLSPTLVELARHRGAELRGPGKVLAMSDAACLAMQAYAKRRGVDIEEYGAVVCSRRPIAKIEAMPERKLWLRYPKSWEPGIEALFRMSPATTFRADIWRAAIFEDAQIAGLASAPAGTPAAPAASTEATNAAGAAA